MDEAGKQRVIFMGTSKFSEIILKKLHDSASFEVVGVYAPPDKKSGRGMKLKYGDVKLYALEQNLPLFQPASLKDPQTQAQLRALNPDFIIVASYGLILPREVLDIPKIAPINVHASLLPRYRGAAPIQRAIMENYGEDAITGISIMRMAEGLDTGDVYAVRECAINQLDYPALEKELANIGAALLVDVMADILKFGLSPVKQDDSLATYAHKLTKEDGIIDWSKSAREIDARIRAVNPWPGARTMFKLSGRDNVYGMNIFPGEIGGPVGDARPGEISRDRNNLKIACADRWYILKNVRMDGKKEISARDFANGHCTAAQGVCGIAGRVDEG